MKTVTMLEVRQGAEGLLRRVDKGERFVLSHRGKHADREWSFTDCVGFSTLHELQVREAFTTDHHFQQAGFVTLLK